MNSLKSFLIILTFWASTLLSASQESLKTIAFAQDTMANDFRKAQVYEVRDEVAKHPNLRFVYSDAKGQTSLLIHQIEKFITMKVDLIILGTNDEEAVVSVVSKAYKNSIPVIVLDRGINGSNYTTFINSDNIEIGKIAAEFIGKKLGGKGKVLLFEGLQKADVTKLRSKGFIDEISKYKEIKLIKRTGNYLRKDTIMEMEKLLNDGIRVDAIFAQSDSMLSGVRSVLYRYNIDPSSLVTVGCDYTNEAKEAIRESAQTASILFPLGGSAAVKVAIEIFNKKDVAKHILIPVKLVTKNNVEDIKAIF